MIMQHPEIPCQSEKICRSLSNTSKTADFMNGYMGWVGTLLGGTTIFGFTT